MKRSCLGYLLVCSVLTLCLAGTTEAQTSLFLSPVTYSFSGGVSSVPYLYASHLLADVNGDGIPDLLVGTPAGGGEILVFLGKGHGDFAPPIVLQYGAVPFGIAVADVNGDGKADILAANGQNKTVSILLGDGTGHFAQPSNISFSIPVFKVIVADVNGDSKIDLLVAGQDTSTNPFGPGTIFVSLGDGKGGFTPASQLNTGTGQLSDFVVADFNGDSKPDLAFGAIGKGGGVGVSLGDGAGNFGTPTLFTSGAGLSSCCRHLDVGDLNKDGHLDLVTGGGDPNLLMAAWLLLGDGTGNFSSKFGPEVGGGCLIFLDVALADVNGDGNLDLVDEVRGCNGHGGISFALGDGKGTFTQQSDSIGLGNFPSVPIMGDLNGDGHPDMIILEPVQFGDNGTILVYMNGQSHPPLPSNVVSLNASSLNPPAGTTLTLTADVQGAGGNPDGTVNFVEGTTTLGSAPVVDQSSGDGLATFMISTLAQGTHTITANYSGSATFVASVSGPLTVTVGTPLPPATTTTLTSSVNPSTVGQAVTLTAHVTSNGGTPSGQLNFLDGSTTIGSQQLDATGSASVVVSTFTAGTHQLTATYAGSTGFQGSTSTVLFQQVSGIDPPGGNYSMAAAPASATVNPGQSASFSITLSATGGFTGTVTLACQGLPANSQCQFSPSSINTSQPNPQATLTVMTSGPNASLRPDGLYLPAVLLGSGPVLFGLVLIGAGGKRRKSALCLFVMVLATMVCISCGGGGGMSNPPPPPPVTPSGTSQVMVIGTSGSLSHQLPITLTVK